MSFWKTTAIKATRKPHRCAYCGRLIPTKSPAEYNAGIWEGELNSYYLCERCTKFIKHYNVDLSEGFSPGDFIDVVYNMGVDCPQCGKSRWREYDWDDDVMILSLECDNCDHKWTADFSMQEV